MAGGLCCEAAGNATPKHGASKDEACNPEDVSLGGRDCWSCGSLGRDCLAAEGPGPVDEAVALPKDVVVIVGPSGVGKSTLIGKLMGEFSGRFGFSVSHTTRQPRPGEEDGVHYNFTTLEAMRDAIADDRFIEYAEVHGNFYGTSYKAVERVVGSGRVCLLDVDVQGAEQLKKSSLDEVSAYMFVAPPSPSALEDRLRGRGTESEDKLRVRLENARKELAFADTNPEFFEQVLVNDDLQRAYAQFRDFMVRSCGKDRLMGSVGADA
mmetsp:Transcript_20568/g.58266  ORF Transcript_20568/g.58266 Transcript_20568/m.58266 type:complete len:266 (+) Transcript_20568:91-888(+)